jgi:molybdopterin/thiamine biosynthesis adenylyltransferase
MLTEYEKARYARQILLKDVGEPGQEQLKKARVLIVGAGGLGSPLALYLCAAGVGTLGIIDDDRVAESNLQRQVLYTTEDVKQSKVKVAAKRLASLNPNVDIRTYSHLLQPEIAAEIIKDYDIVLDGCDNLATRYLINDTCVQLDKVYVYGAISEFRGQVAVFNYRGGPTYRCLFPETEGMENNPAPQGVLGSLPGVVATIQATEAIKLICGIGTPLSGQVLLIDLLTNKFDKIGLQRQCKY